MVDSFSGPETYDNFGHLDPEGMGTYNTAVEGTQRYFRAGPYDQEFNRQVDETTHANYYYNEPQPHHRRVANINIIVPDQNQINGPGLEYSGDEEEEIGANGTRARRFVRLFKKKPENSAVRNREEWDALRAAKKVLHDEIKGTRRLRHRFIKERDTRRANMRIKKHKPQIGVF